ncbi:MAG: energy transducer TonB [Bacteroidetes bacterium]|nr:energy transducer TonB [Bacteroidota bacterium]
MRTYIILIIGLLSINSYAQKTTDEKKIAENKATTEIIKVKKEIETSVTEEQVPEIFTLVEEMPQFPGGEKEKINFVRKNIVFPESAKKNKTFGKCFLKFAVMKDGSIKEIVILKGVPNCPECDEEAKRVISIMPTWIPGKQNGHLVNVYSVLPINFSN